jgi:hypothetical protein
MATLINVSLFNGGGALVVNVDHIVTISAAPTQPGAVNLRVRGREDDDPIVVFGPLSTVIDQLVDAGVNIVKAGA